jgi:hypothetical protein
MAKTDIREVHSNFGYRNWQNELFWKVFHRNLNFFVLGSGLQAQLDLYFRSIAQSPSAALRDGFFGPNVRAANRDEF